MTIIDLNNDKYRKCKLRFSPTVIYLYMKPETCCPNCLKAKVRGQSEMFAISHLVTS